MQKQTTSAYDTCKLRPKAESALGDLKIGDIVEAYYHDDDEPELFIVVRMVRYNRKEFTVTFLPFGRWGERINGHSDRWAATMGSDLNTDKWQVVGHVALGTTTWTKDTGYGRPAQAE